MRGSLLLYTNSSSILGKPIRLARFYQIDFVPTRGHQRSGDVIDTWNNLETDNNAKPERVSIT